MGQAEGLRAVQQLWEPWGHGLGCKSQGDEMREPAKTSGLDSHAGLGMARG